MCSVCIGILFAVSTVCVFLLPAYLWYNLANLLQDFDELLCIAEQGDHRNIDILVRDTYGGSHAAHGLPADLIASSFGKAARSTRDSIGYCHSSFVLDLFAHLV